MNDRELTVGVLGGMGPEATIDFMSDVLRLTRADRDQDHIHLIVDQNPKVPNRQRAIRERSGAVDAALAAMARRLEAAGADFLVMPCNSAHAFGASIREATTRPFVSIVDVSIEAVRALSSARGRVGVMATDGLAATGIYQEALREAGLEAVLPEDECQQRLMSAINRVKAGDKSAGLRADMLAVAVSLTERGAGVVLAACTEIPLVLSGDDLSVPLVSSTEALARRAVALARCELALPVA